MQEGVVAAIRPIVPRNLSPFDAVYATHEEKPLIVILSGSCNRMVALVREGHPEEDLAALSLLLPFSSSGILTDNIK
jgi:hypothetical protein